MASAIDDDGTVTQDDVHRAQAVHANNAAWELLTTPVRSPAQDEELLRRAYAAAYHWALTPSATPLNEVRACYMVGKAWLSLGDAERALGYAERMLADCAVHEIDDFDLAYSLELLARASKALGKQSEAEAAMAAARAIPVADDGDRAQVQSDLEEF